MFESKNFVAIAPGETIREQLENRFLSQKEFAKRMDMSEKHISRLINGKVELTMNVAIRLEAVLGLPASFWNNMESIFREQIIRVEAELEMEEDKKIVSKMPYAEIAKFGWVPTSRKSDEKVKNFRAFFEVAKLGLLSDLQIPGIAYRVKKENDNNDYKLAVWVQKAKLEARNKTVGPINISKLEKKMQSIRELNRLEPSVFFNELELILSDCGIALVLLPHLSGSFLHGASFVDGNRIVLGLTIRGGDADKFWFSLFHELYHIISGHISCSEKTSAKKEIEADLFAKDMLIPSDKFNEFKDRNDYSKESILMFSEEIKIDAGIVIGRLQYEKILPYSKFSALKKQYKLI